MMSREFAFEMYLDDKADMDKDYSWLVFHGHDDCEAHIRIPREYAMMLTRWNMHQPMIIMMKGMD